MKLQVNLIDSAGIVSAGGACNGACHAVHAYKNYLCSIVFQVFEECLTPDPFRNVQVAC